MLDECPYHDITEGESRDPYLYTFGKWVSIAILQNVYASFAHPYIPILSVMGSPKVQQLLTTYIVDLIRVLIELFNTTIRLELALTMTVVF